MTDIIITEDGTIRFIWTDALACLVDEGKPNVRRVSRVEPTDEGKWTADMALVGGPILGSYWTREEALIAERRWLSAHGY